MTQIIDALEAAQGALLAWQNCFSNSARTDNALAKIDAALAAAREQQPVALGPEWTPCCKLPVTVHVREQRAGETHISTREGITPVLPDDLIMRGVDGEEYPIGRALFEKTYRIGAAPPAQDAEDAARRLAEVREIYAGMDGFVPQTAAEGYCLEIIRKMAHAAIARE